MNAAVKLQATGSRTGQRYERRRQAIISAATELLNVHGAKGMRLADVAAKLGLTTTSVTYYYRRKEDLAVACFSAGLQRFEAMIGEASRPADPAERVRLLIRIYLEIQTQVRQGKLGEIPVFSDIRSLKEPRHTQMVDAWVSMLGKVAALFRAPGYEWMGEVGRLARAQVLLEQLLWSRAWLFRYSLDDFPRIERRMVDVLLNGVAGPGRTWAPQRLALGAEPRPDLTGQEMFLGAATRLINDRGYRAASVSDIAAELHLTKGSFYHHNQAKDDLVVACFKRTFNFMRGVQRQVRDIPGDEWGRLSTTAAALVEHQLSPNGPLLRASALSALPVEIRAEMVRQSERVSGHFASMISDGVAEGCIRPVDPFIASWMIMAMINTASDLAWLKPGVKVDDVAAIYARPLLVGLLQP